MSLFAAAALESRSKHHCCIMLLLSTTYLTPLARAVFRPPPAARQRLLLITPTLMAPPSATPSFPFLFCSSAASSHLSWSAWRCMRAIIPDFVLFPNLLGYDTFLDLIIFSFLSINSLPHIQSIGLTLFIIIPLSSHHFRVACLFNLYNHLFASFFDFFLLSVLSVSYISVSVSVLLLLLCPVFWYMPRRLLSRIPFHHSHIVPLSRVLFVCLSVCSPTILPPSIPWFRPTLSTVSCLCSGFCDRHY
ncbi:hypothetical protein BJ912DRAFT_280754 [Pholiota molesta]|nr:hypothetical protein BJ912DRAFT_280754 [Pholiota molesta]